MSKRSLCLASSCLSLVLASPALAGSAAEPNAYALWTNAAAGLWMPDDGDLRDALHDMCDFETIVAVGRARRKLDGWLDSRQSALRPVSDGIALGRFRFAEPGTDDPALRVLGDLRLAARAKCALGRRHAERGAHQEAAREFVEIVRMGQMICAGGGCVVDFLVGCAIQTIGLNGLDWLCAQAGMPVETLQEALRQLPAPEAGDEALARTLRVDYEHVFRPYFLAFVRDAASPTNRYPVAVSNLVDEAETARLAEGYYARAASNALSAWSKRDTRIAADADGLVDLKGFSNEAPARVFLDLTLGLSRPDRDEPQWRRLAELGRTQTNLVGMMYATMAVMPETILDRSVRVRTRQSLTRALLAVSVFRSQQGRLPSSLEEVCAKGLLAELPRDLFADAPLRYAPERGLLWSVGPDSVDDGGDAEKDIVVPLSRGALKPPR